MTTLLCINSRARSGETFDREPVVESLRRLGPIVEHDPCAGDDLAEVARRIGPDLSRVVVGGGDGTLNCSLPGLLEAGVPLGVSPLGTANDFARSLGLPLEPTEAVDVIVAGQTRRVGLGQANGRWFLNAAGVGLGPELTKTLDRDKKRRLGVLAYVSSLIEVVGDRKRRKATIHVPGRTPRRTSFIQVTIANGVHYGGGLTITDDASLEDGQLYVLVLKPQTAPELLKKFFMLLRGVRRGEERSKILLYRTDSLRIETHHPVDVTVDGELVGRTPLDCRCVPEALEVYAPPPEASGSTDS